MTAVLRRPAAPALPAFRPSARILQRWYDAVPLRREWLAAGMSTEPADRRTAETRIGRIYARLLRPAPAMRWVDSPRQALPLVRGLPTHETLHRLALRPQRTGPPPVASDIAAGLSGLRGRLDEAATHPDLDPPPRPKAKDGTRSRRKSRLRDEAPDRADPPRAPGAGPVQLLEEGVALRAVLREHVREELTGRLAAELAWPVRRALGPTETLPVHWYGQQDAPWLAYYDVLHRLGLAVFRPADAEALEDWVWLARSAGWWWPGDELCVLVERPAQITPTTVRYRDGWSPPRR